MSEWQPIETAPRDGQQILVFTADGWLACVEFRKLSDGTSCWEMAHDKHGTITALACNATHWMPLPEPPEETP